MKKNLRYFALLGLTALSLASCYKECTYAEFIESAKKVEKVEYTKVTFSGKYDYEVAGVTATLDMNGTEFTKESGNWKASDSSKATQSAVGLVFLASRPADVAEDTSGKTKYFYNDGFKVESTEDNKTSIVEWNNFGYLTSWSYNGNTLTVSYTK